MKTRRNHLLKVSVVFCLALYVSASLAAEAVVRVVEGSVTRIDATTRVVAVTATDGTEHAFYSARDFAVHGGEDTGKGVADGLGGIRVGSKIAAHYTVESGRETVHELDRLGDGGLKVAHGTSAHINREAKTLSIKTDDGAIKTFHLTDHAAKETGETIAADGTKTAKVTVYYSEQTAKKTAHLVVREF